MSLQFVNVNGNPWNPSAASTVAKKRAKKDEESFHGGWRVTGIPPGAMEEAQEGNRRLASMARNSGGKPIPDFDQEKWLAKAKRKAVRAKPYSLPQAAAECMALAVKAGWLRVEVVEIKKEIQAA